MKTVYMGTPDFAVPPLKALVEAGYEVAAVVTQPDKPKGRGKTLMATPVKEEALMHEIPVYQPQKIRNNQEFLVHLRKSSRIHYRSSFRTDHSERGSGTSEIRMHQYSCITSAEVQRSCTHSAGCDRRGEGIRCYHHADGRRTGYRRYAFEDRDPSG